VTWIFGLLPMIVGLLFLSGGGGASPALASSAYSGSAQGDCRVSAVI